MKAFKQILSALTAAAMSLSLLTGIFPVQAEDPEIRTKTTEDVRYSAESPLGALMLDSIESGEPPEAADHSCAISDVRIENGMASVSYFTGYACDLVIGFYSDDGTEMYDSVSAHVEATASETGGNDQTELLLPDGLPEYYLVKAFLVGDDFQPLCPAFSTTLYTEEITAVRRAKATDFDESLIVNLDESTDTNFLVLREDTVHVYYDGVANLLSSYDEDTGIYSFSDIDSSIADLQPGDTVYYDYDGQQLVFTVESITLDRTDAVIQAGDMQLSDAFSLVKIEETLHTTPEDPGETDMGYGLTYTGNPPQSSGGIPPLAGIGVTLGSTYEWEATLKEAKPVDTKVFKGTAELTAKMSFSAAITIDVTIYQTGLFTGYQKVDIGYEVVAEGSLEGKISGTLYLKREQANVLGLIGFDVGVGIRMELSGSLKHELTITQTTTLYFGDYDGDRCIVNKPNITLTIYDVEASFFIGFVAESKATVLDNEYGTEARAGAQVTVKSNPYHSKCILCFNGKTELVASVSFYHTDSKKETQRTTPLKLNVLLFKFHYSTYCGFGKGDCPYLNQETGRSTEQTRVSTDMTAQTLMTETTSSTNPPKDLSWEEALGSTGATKVSTGHTAITTGTEVTHSSTNPPKDLSWEEVLGSTGATKVSTGYTSITTGTEVTHSSTNPPKDISWEDVLGSTTDTDDTCTSEPQNSSNGDSVIEDLFGGAFYLAPGETVTETVTETIPETAATSDEPDEKSVPMLQLLFGEPLTAKAEDGTLTAQFTDLEPGVLYNFYSMVSRETQAPLAPENLLYIDQRTADADGTLEVTYIPSQSGWEPVVLVVQYTGEANSAEEAAEPPPLGDLSGDGTVNASDAALILIAAASLGAGNGSGLTEEQEADSDVNGDSIINASDAAVVLIYAAAIGAGQDVKLTDFVK